MCGGKEGEEEKRGKAPIYRLLFIRVRAAAAAASWSMDKKILYHATNVKINTYLFVLRNEANTKHYMCVCDIFRCVWMCVCVFFFGRCVRERRRKEKHFLLLSPSCPVRAVAAASAASAAATARKEEEEEEGKALNFSSNHFPSFPPPPPLPFSSPPRFLRQKIWEIGFLLSCGEEGKPGGIGPVRKDGDREGGGGANSMCVGIATRGWREGDLPLLPVQISARTHLVIMHDFQIQY